MPVRLFVGNLSYDASEAELRQHFGTIGPVSYCYLPTDRETGRPRGFAFVEFADDSFAQEAISRLNNQPFRGRPLAVKEAQPRQPGAGPGPRPPMGGGGGTGAPRFGGPRPPMGGGPPSGDGAFARRPAGAANFGPDAPPKGKKGKFKPSEPRGPKGPIRVKPDGRIYSTEDLDEGDDTFEGDNFATRAEPDEDGAEIATRAEPEDNGAQLATRAEPEDDGAEE